MGLGLHVTSVDKVEGSLSKKLVIGGWGRQGQGL